MNDVLLIILIAPFAAIGFLLFGYHFYFTFIPWWFHEVLAFWHFAWSTI